MSRVYFHSRQGDAHLLGTERHYAALLCANLCATVLGLSGRSIPDDLERYRRLLPADAWPLHTREDGAFLISLRAYLGSSSEGDVLIPGTDRRLSTMRLALNTAVAAGGDALRLHARLHAQCEIHGYVEGPNRAWLAGVIEEGLTSAVLRSRIRGYPTGWQDVLALLRRTDDGPVVTSYSVTDQFPNRTVAGWTEDDDDGEAWYALPEDERWERAVAGLRAGNMGRMLEWKPETWGYGFGPDPAYSAFDVVAAWDAEPWEVRP